MQDVIYNLLHHSSMQASLACGNHAMRQDSLCHALNIIRDGIIAPGDGGMSLAGAIESHSATRTDSQFDGIMETSGTYQFDYIALNAWLDTHSPDQLLQNLQVFS